MPCIRACSTKLKIHGILSKIYAVFWSWPFWPVEKAKKLILSDDMMIWSTRSMPTTVMISLTFFVCSISAWEGATLPDG